VGLVLACVLFVRRMATLFKVHATSADGLAWRLHGALFFGATDKLDVLLEAAQTVPVGSTMTLDMAALFALDTTGVDSLEQLLKALEQRGAHLALEGMQPQVQSLLERSGLTEKLNLAR
jgi:SulP family sulfate permease